MEFIRQNLQANKVTLDIKTNDFEEKYEYNAPANRFDQIENLLELFKLVSRQKPAAVHSKTIKDPIIYSILIHLDPTLDLVSDKQLFIAKFKSELKDKINNYVEKLKKFGATKEATLTAIDDVNDNRAHLMYYLSILLDKNIAIKTDNNIHIYEIGKLECLVIQPQNYTSQTIDLIKCRELKYDARKTYHTNENTLGKLNDMLVKDLKSLAEELGICTTKTEDGKRKNLLKAELKDVIKVKLYA